VVVVVAELVVRVAVGDTARRPGSAARQGVGTVDTAAAPHLLPFHRPVGLEHLVC